MALPILGPIIDIVGQVVDRVIPDPVQKAQLTLELAKLADVANQREHEELMGQIEINKVEAANLNVFVAGWRPAIGWGCGAALVYNTLVAPLFGLGMADLGFLQTVLMAMLGIGGMRSFEKVKGVAQDLPVRAPKPEAPAPAPEKKGPKILPDWLR
jgi:hypothetical protein